MRKIITCNNEMCLYEEDGTCTQKEITLDHRGRCRQGMNIILEPELIKEKKQKFWEMVSRDDEE